ncbi:MAG: YfhO family protein [Bryobacterales bacterium]|nr:YfhO family protein [Bryobacterales bacterium]
MAFGVFALAALFFYWIPLTDPATTPQWDTIDYHYSVQKYFSDVASEGRLPLWSDRAFSGYPFLADPQTGAWYPLNWPFFALGITPKSLMTEIALHALLALIGAWLLAGRWLHNGFAAGITAVCYAFSGYFAGHATHLGMFQSAAWLPLLLYGLHRSIEDGRLRTMALTGAGAACMFLAGHFQTALYLFAALALYGAVLALLLQRWRAAFVSLAVISGLTVLLSAVQLIPTAELVMNSTRAGVRYLDQTGAPLVNRALWTLVSPNHYGSISGAYTGPVDITEFFLYGGILLLPLAILGLICHRLRWAALALLIPALWYAYGPPGGLYNVVAQMPGFGAVRAPVHAWFVVAMALALAAGGGAAWLSGTLRWRYLGLAIALIAFIDLFYWNSLENRLPYARTSFETLYAQPQESFFGAVRRVLPPGTRFHSAGASPAFGPMNNSYDLGISATYGSNPLRLSRYEHFFAAAALNPKLVNELNAGGLLDSKTGEIMANPAALPRFYIPPALSRPDNTPILGQLVKLDPAAMSLVEGRVDRFRQDAAGKISVKQADAGRYKLEISVQSPTLLRAAIAWYPGWRAAVDGHPVQVEIVDHALMGIPIPAGRHQVNLVYHSTTFLCGAAISLATTLALFILRKRLAIHHIGR